MTFMILDGFFEISKPVISIAEIAGTPPLSSFVLYFNSKMQIVRIVEDLLDSRLR